MKKIKTFLCLALVLSLALPSINFTSIAQENITETVNEVSINWEKVKTIIENEQVEIAKEVVATDNIESQELEPESTDVEDIIYLGKFDISNEYSEDSKVYIGSKDAKVKSIDLLLNEKNTSLNFKKSSGILEGYVTSEITDSLSGTKGDIQVSEDIFESYKFEDMKVLVVNTTINEESSEMVVEQADNNEAETYNLKASTYLPVIDTTGAKTTEKNTDTYALDLKWRKTKPGVTSNNHENGTVLNKSNFTDPDQDRKYVLEVNPNANNATSPKLPLQTPDMVRKDKDYGSLWLDYRSLLSYIEPTADVSWTPDGEGILIDGWKHTDKNNYQSVSWRMYRGTFKLTQTQINELKSGKSQLFLGVQTEDGDPATILGVNDYLSVLANGQMTNINIATDANSTKPLNLITYSSDASNATQLYNSRKLDLECNASGYIIDEDHRCDNTLHNNIGKNPSTIDGWHLHLNEKYQQNANATLLGDVTSYFVNGTTSPDDVHRLEMLTGEICGTGGVTKLEVFYVKKPQISATKTAYKLDSSNNEVEVTEDKPITIGDKVYFKFGMKNTGEVNITENIHFKDYNEKLGIGLYIDKTGVYNYGPKSPTDSTLEKKSTYYYGTEQNGLDKIVIKKYSGNSDTPSSTATGKSQIESILSSLLPGERLEVTSAHNVTGDIEDAFLYHQKDNTNLGETIVNTVTVGCTYMNEELIAEDDASITINIVDANVTLTKDIVKVNNQAPLFDENNIAITNPGNVVTFKITLKNNNSEPALRLSLGDILKLNGTKVKDITEFYSDEACKQKVNDTDKFTIGANGNRILYAKYTVPPTAEHGSQYDNIATVYQTKEEGSTIKTPISTDNAEFKVVEQKGSLKFKKLVNQNGLSNDTQQFTVNIKGSDNTEYNIRLNKNTEVTLSNLSYGVEYTITEVAIPMNYEYTSISFGATGSSVNISNKVLTVTLDSTTDGRLVTVNNKKINDKGLFDGAVISNTFTYIKDVITGGTK